MPRVILFYNTMWGSPLEFPQAASFALTTDRNAAELAAAIVFHLPTLPRDVIPNGLNKRQGQLWIAWSLECEANYPEMRNPNFMRHFDLTMTYRLDADIAAPYLDSGCRERLRTLGGRGVCYNFPAASGRLKGWLSCAKSQRACSYSLG